MPDPEVSRVFTVFDPQTVAVDGVRLRVVCAEVAWAGMQRHTHVLAINNGVPCIVEPIPTYHFFFEALLSSASIGVEGVSITGLFPAVSIVAYRRCHTRHRLPIPCTAVTMPTCWCRFWRRRGCRQSPWPTTSTPSGTNHATRSIRGV